MRQDLNPIITTQIVSTFIRRQPNLLHAASTDEPGNDWNYGLSLLFRNRSSSSGRFSVTKNICLQLKKKLTISITNEIVTRTRFKGQLRQTSQQTIMAKVNIKRISQ